MERERLAIIETKLDLIQKTMDQTQLWMKSRDEHSDKRYAPKWIMYPLVTIGTAILMAVIGAILGLILVPTARAIAMVYINLFT